MAVTLLITVLTTAEMIARLICTVELEIRSRYTHCSVVTILQTFPKPIRVDATHYVSSDSVMKREGIRHSHNIICCYLCERMVSQR